MFSSRQSDIPVVTNDLMIDTAIHTLSTTEDNDCLFKLTPIQLNWLLNQPGYADRVTEFLIHAYRVGKMTINEFESIFSFDSDEEKVGTKFTFYDKFAPAVFNEDNQVEILSLGTCLESLSSKIAKIGTDETLVVCSLRSPIIRMHILLSALDVSVDRFKHVASLIAKDNIRYLYTVLEQSGGNTERISKARALLAAFSLHLGTDLVHLRNQLLPFRYRYDIFFDNDV